MKTDILLGRLEKVRKHSKGWTACCPAHEDKTASLSVTERDGRLLIHCFAGCAAASVMAAVGLELADLFDDHKSESPSMARRDAANALSIACAQSPSVGFDIEVCLIGIEHTLAGVPFATQEDEATYIGALTRVLAILNKFNQLRKYHG
jgi:hypothetical protein